jgi:molybdopterin synthase catalytic subunit
MSAPAVRIAVQAADFDVATELARARERQGGRVGAVASFTGLVRDRHDDAAVTELLLEHYPGMTEQSIAAVVAQALGRWSLLDVTVIHRVGQLGGGDQIVFVQVASGHRAEAFAACEFLMDYLKTDAVIWKREARRHGDTGAGEAVWVESTAADAARRGGWDDSGG